MPAIRSIPQIQKELKAKQAQLKKLQAERGKIAKALGQIDKKISAIAAGATPVKRSKAKKVTKAAKKPSKPGAARTTQKRKIAVTGGRRGRGGPNLADVLAQVLVGKGSIKVAEATKLALGAGYKSKSSQFGNIVSQTLSADKRFEKLARGVYRLKGATAKAAPKAAKKAAKKAPPKKSAEKKAKPTAAKKAGKKAAPRKIAPKAGGLKGLLVQLLAGRKAVGVGEATDAVLAAGYKTKSEAFRGIVNQTLIKGKEFKQVSRGKYALKG